MVFQSRTSDCYVWSEQSHHATERVWELPAAALFQFRMVWRFSEKFEDVSKESIRAALCGRCYYHTQARNKKGQSHNV